MVFCPKCGSSNEEQAVTCQKCGAQLSPPRYEAYNYHETQFDRTFRGIGPLLKTLVAFIFVLLLIEILKALGGSGFAARMSDFLSDNLLVIFLVLLLAAYSGYASRRYPREHYILAPLIAAVLITFVLWLMANVMEMVGLTEDVDGLLTLSDVLFSIVYIIFLLVLLLGYIGVIMRANQPQPPQAVLPAPYADQSASAAAYGPRYQCGSRRMGRSTRNKVLFGVCGGMAEHFNTDPFMVRVLWVIGLLVSFGGFALAYVILAVVLPNNP